MMAPSTNVAPVILMQQQHLMQGYMKPLSMKGRTTTALGVSIRQQNSFILNDMKPLFMMGPHTNVAPVIIMHPLHLM